jgi:hypothetical protein
LYRIYPLGDRFILGVQSSWMPIEIYISQIDPLGKIWSVKKLFDVMEYLWLSLQWGNVFGIDPLGKNKSNEKFISVRIYLKESSIRDQAVTI